MKRSILYISSLIFTGCSSKSFIALSDSGKEQNAIIIKTNGGSVVLNRAGSYVTLNSKDEIPKSIKYMPPQKLKEKFSMLYKNIPQKPRSYIVFFKSNSTELTQESKKTLKRVIKEIEKNSPCVIDIIGHTDTTGSAKLNKRLSLNRANYIKNLIFQNRNIKISKLRVKGYGEERLFVKTLNNIPEPKNRSVEIFIR
jgi:outer membrane protein OmpA-like peptidoglycan-associated protein